MLHPARSQHDADMYAMAERYRAATSGGGLATNTAPPPATDESWRHPDEQVRVVPPPEEDLIRAGVVLEPTDVESVPLFDSVDPDEDPFALSEEVAPDPEPKRRPGRPRKTIGQIG